MFSIAGSNVFNQWLNPFDKIPKFGENISVDLENLELAFIGWSYNIFRSNNDFYITGDCFDQGLIRVHLPDNCVKGSHSKAKLQIVGNDQKLILTNSVNQDIWILKLATLAQWNWEHKKLMLNTETSLGDKKKRLKTTECIANLVATNTSTLCITSGGSVYQLPNKIDTSKCNGKVSGISCGYEHFVLLNDTGSVYSWGNGRRCQLGHGDLTSLEVPKEIEALAGVKIVKISAGGWHTLALSEEGDLYAWGWNDTGQIGINNKPEQEQKKIEERKTKKHSKCASLQSYPVPVLVDFYMDNGDLIELNVKDIACGTKHSIVLLEDNSVWVTGCNKYGQLGLDPEPNPMLYHFKNIYTCNENISLMCGPWSSVLLRCK